MHHDIYNGGPYIIIKGNYVGKYFNIPVGTKIMRGFVIISTECKIICGGNDDGEDMSD